MEERSGRGRGIGAVIQVCFAPATRGFAKHRRLVEGIAPGKRRLLVAGWVGWAALGGGCGGDAPPPATAAAPVASAAPPQVAPVSEPVNAVAPAPPPAPVSDPPPVPADRVAGYLAVWKDYFAKENGITPEEFDKRVTVKKTSSEVRDYSRTFLEITIDVTSDWATVRGATSEILTRIKARSSEPPPNVRFDVWLEPADYAAMKQGKALITTRYNFGKLRFTKQADAEAAATKACKGRTRVHDFQVGIAGDGDPWLLSLFQTEGRENWPCGVDLVKTKGGEIMNFDAGEAAFK